jgi:2-polyprenyl-3-methyl-5-hydroxy-6-metoxy-1,4-benzoquinol methylase
MSEEQEFRTSDSASWPAALVGRAIRWRRRQEAAQVARTVARHVPRGGRLLDLGCGPGRHTLPLARSGYTVTAVDTSAGLLKMLENQNE